MVSFCNLKHKEIVFFDISYILFFKYHATLRFLKCKSTTANNAEGVATVCDDTNVFIAAFEKSVYNLFGLLNKKDLPIKDIKWCFAKDTPRKTIWRNNIHDKYKGSRVSHDDNITLKKAFSLFWNTIYPKLEKDFNISLISYDTAEADDVIAIGVKHIKETFGDNVTVHVITKDHDLVQLCALGATVRSVEIKKNKSFLIDFNSKYDDIILKNFITYKCLIGDASDNIPGISKVFLDPKHKTMRAVGPKTAIAIIEGKFNLTYILDRNEEAREIFMKNKKLMDFNEIPEEIKKGIITQINKHICA